jgi:hypothetical protein
MENSRSKPFPILEDEVHWDNIFGKCIPAIENESQRMEQLIRMFPKQAFQILDEWLKNKNNWELRIYDNKLNQRIK